MAAALAGAALTVVVLAELLEAVVAAEALFAEDQWHPVDEAVLAAL